MNIISTAVFFVKASIFAANISSFVVPAVSTYKLVSYWRNDKCAKTSSSENYEYISGLESH